MESRTSSYRKAGAVAALCFALYLSNCRTVPVERGADTIPNRLIPFSILRYGTITLDPFRADFEALLPHKVPFVLERRGSLVSFYPVGTALGALPFYVPAAALLAIRGSAGHEGLFAASEQTEKFAAAAITALAVAIFYLTVRRRLPPREASWFAIAFGLGTSMWATASQMLWQQTVVAAAATVALWLLTWPGLPRWAAASAGAVLSLAVAARPTAGLLLLAGLAAVVATAKGRRFGTAVWFCLAAVPLIAFSSAVNAHYYEGHITGAYGLLLTSTAEGMLAPGRLAGIAGLLVSPNRGLFIFSPVAVLGAIGLVWQLYAREGRDPVLVPFAAAAAAHLFVSGTYYQWWGGWSFGPRYLVDILPVLGLAAASIWNRVPSWARRLSAFALVLSVLAQFNGAFCYPASLWNGLVLDRYQEAAPWMWSRFELWEDFRHWVWLRTWAAPY